jgi:hypothetical protein
MAGQLNLSLLISADAKGVAPATREARREIEGIGQSATQTTAATRLLSAANDEASASQRRAMEAARGRAAAERDLQDAVARFAGIKPVMGDDGYRQRAADIEAYGSALDDLRARHSPLFAVQRQYQQNLTDIDQALKLGAISETEHAAAIARAGAAHQFQTTLLTQSGAATKLNAFEIQNLSFQANDIAMMLMSGQSFGIIMAQQGMQVAQIFGKRGLGEIIPALGGAFRSLISPTTLFLGAVTAAGYAGYAAYQAMVPEVKTLDDAVDAHRNSVDLLRASYGDLDAVMKSISRSGEVAFNSASLRTDQATIRKTQRDLGPDLVNKLRGGDDWASWLNGGPVDIDVLTNLSGQQKDFAPAVRQFLDTVRQGKPDLAAFEADIDRLFAKLAATSDNPGALRNTADGLKVLAQGAVEVDAKFAPFSEAINRLQLQMAEGNEDLAQFQDTVDAIGKAKGLRELADEAILLGKELVQVNRLMLELRQLERVAAAGQRGALLGSSAEDERNRYLDQQRSAIRDRQRQFDADMLGMRARSPAEREAAARARAELAKNKDEGAEARQQRIDDAGLRARTEAEHDLTRAQDERRRSLDETLASARLDLDLVGKSVAETERLRTEHQLLAEVRRVAAVNNVQVDQAEIERIREIAAETAKLRVLQQARDFIRTQDEELAKMRMEQQLIGVSEGLRNRLTAAMEAELEIRRLGTDASGQEAANIRRTAEALAAQRTELERQAEAWDTYRSAGESAIDGVIDRLSEGDLKGAGQSLIDDGKKFTTELLGNTVKNAMFNTNLPTIGDLPGFVSKLFGGADKGAAGIVSSALGQSVGAMNVNAGIVNISGGLGVGTLTGKGGGFLEALGIDKPSAKDIIRMPLPDVGASVGMTKTGVPLSNVTAGSLTAKVSTEYADRFQGLFNELKERGYPISSLGEGGYSFRKVAGSSNLSRHAFGEAVDINPRENPWSFSGRNTFDDYGIDPSALARKYGLKWGGDWNKPDTMHFQVDKSIENLAAKSSLAGANIDKMATNAIGATKELGTLGAGAGQLGQGLANMFPAAPAAPAAGGGFFSWLGSLFGGGTTTFPAAPPSGGLWEVGGFTGLGNPKDAAGLVHKEEYVFSAPAVRAIGLGNLDAMHRAAKTGYAEGGYAMPDSWTSDVPRGGSRGSYSGSQPFAVQFINRGTPQEVVSKRQESDGRGGRLEIYELRDQLSAAATDPNSTFRRTLGSMGAEPQRPRR